MNVLIDETTLETEIVGGRHNPSRYPNMTCRTANGNEIDISEAASMAYWAHIRRVVHTSSRVVTDLGRRERAFRASARDAGMLLNDRCAWPGCNRKLRNCQADHSITWKQHGTTKPANCSPLCGRHNRLKDRGNYTTQRQPDGTWQTLDTNGHPIG